jgi:hypothetical protein
MWIQRLVWQRTEQKPWWLSGRTHIKYTVRDSPKLGKNIYMVIITVRIFVSLPNPHHQASGIRRWDLWGEISHEGKTLIKKVGWIFIPYCPSTMWGHTGGMTLKQREALRDAKSVNILILNFLVSGTWIINFYCLQKWHFCYCSTDRKSHSHSLKHWL